MIGYTSFRLPAYAVLAATGLVAGLALGRVEPVALAAPFLLALVGGLAVHEPEVSVRVSLDRDRVIEGDEVTATIGLTSTRGADRFELFAPLPPGLESPAQAFRLRAGEEQTLELQLRCEHWGVFRVGQVLFRARDMLGLRSWEGEAGEAQPLRVFPREETLRSLVAPLETQVFAGNQVSRVRGEGIEFADLRAWQPGDRIRRVNWRASALRGELWVNEQHPERNTDVVLFLDTLAEERGQARSTHLRAVRAAATLAHGYLQRKDRVGLVGFGGFVSWLVPESGLRQLYTIVDRLLASEVVESHATHRGGLLAPRLLPPKALVLALTPLFDDRTATALLDLRARGYDVVVIEIASPAAPAPLDPAEQPLAERLWRLSREALHYRFAEVGIPVVTWHEGDPLAAPLAEVNAFRHLARPA